MTLPGARAAGFAARLRLDIEERPFRFATGIECSYPVITGNDGRDHRVDEYESTGHYRRWREDFALVEDLGISFLRYGVPYYLVHRGPGRYDWSFVDETFASLHDRGITPIADLCHFGLPPFLENFQNPDFPAYFAEYARDFAHRYPWVRFFTPVNEIRVVCEFSALRGWWNERRCDDASFVRAMAHCARATLLAEEAILAVQPDAVFVQSEATSYFHPCTPAALERTRFLNQRRFLGLDLCYGHDVSAGIFQYLVRNGMTPREYGWFMQHASRLTPFCVMGNDSYATNEHMVPDDGGQPVSAGVVYGYSILTRQYYDRYGLPVMHTETNQLGGEGAVRWLRNQWLNLIKLKQDGVPLLGFTWYGLLDQVDWDTALREDNGHVDPLGLYDLDRRIRPVGQAYRVLIRAWQDVLPPFQRVLTPSWSTA